MSDPVAEQSITAADFRSRILSAYQRGGTAAPRKVEFLGSFSDGTRYMVENGVRAISFYVVTDLTAPTLKVFRVGTVGVNIAANVFSGNASVAMTPPLDATANYKTFASANDADVAWSARAYLLNVNTMIVSAFRNPVPSQTSLSSTNVTVAGADLTDVDVTIFNPHGSDIGVGPHGHTALGFHTVTDPTHLHGITATGGAITVNVDWMLVHI